MNLIKLTRKKTKDQPKTLRTLSADECRIVSGGTEDLRSIVVRVDENMKQKQKL